MMKQLTIAMAVPPVRQKKPNMDWPDAIKMSVNFLGGFGQAELPSWASLTLSHANGNDNHCPYKTLLNKELLR